MSKIVRKTEAVLERLPQDFYLSKIRYGEETAIRKKKPLFSDVCWTAEQTAAFEAYLMQHYGAKIRPWWHQLYQSMNGVFHVDYFPEILFSTKLEPLLNPPAYSHVFSDKSLTQTVYGQADGVKFPETVLVNCNGLLLSGDQKLISIQDALKTLKNIGKCIIKPTVDSGSGKGVRFLDIRDGVDVLSNDPTDSIISKSQKNYIVQKVVKNHQALSDLYPGSLNTIRAITYIAKDDIHCAPLALRLGVGGNRLDNIHCGGLVVGVNPDGTLKEYAYQLGYGNSKSKFRQHPDTNRTFAGASIGDAGRIISAAKRLHALTPQLGVISWDLTFDEEKNVVLIEANCQNQAVWFTQIISEEPFFGKNTEYMIDLIRKK